MVLYLVAVLKRADSGLFFLPGLWQLFPKNSGWIKKTYQRISPFGKSGPSEPVSGACPEKSLPPQTRNPISEIQFHKMKTSLLFKDIYVPLLSGLWPEESGYNSGISLRMETNFCLLFLPDIRQLFPKNSGWIKKTYQRISPFGKSGPSEPVSGAFPEKCVPRQTRNPTSEKPTLKHNSNR